MFAGALRCTQLPQERPAVDLPDPTEASITLMEGNLMTEAIAHSGPLATIRWTRCRPEDTAAAVSYAATQPDRVAVNEILIRPTDQEQS